MSKSIGSRSLYLWPEQKEAKKGGWRGAAYYEAGASASVDRGHGHAVVSSRKETF